MRYFLASLILIVLFFFPSVVIAKEATATSTPRVKSQLLTVNKEEKLDKVRNSAQTHSSVLKKAVVRVEVILNKLQERIGKMSAAGKNTSQVDSLMTDARAKLNDAKTKITEIEKVKDSARTKADFQAIQAKFKLALQNLQLAKKDASQIISLLKSFNAATPSATTK